MPDLHPRKPEASRREERSIVGLACTTISALRSEIQTQVDFGIEFPNEAAEDWLKFPTSFPHVSVRHTWCLTSGSRHPSDCAEDRAEDRAEESRGWNLAH